MVIFLFNLFVLKSVWRWMGNFLFFFFLFFGLHDDWFSLKIPISISSHTHMLSLQLFFNSLPVSFLIILPPTRIILNHFCWDKSVWSLINISMGDKSIGLNVIFSLLSISLSNVCVCFNINSSKWAWFIISSGWWLSSSQRWKLLYSFSIITSFLLFLLL